MAGFCTQYILICIHVSRILYRTFLGEGEKSISFLFFLECFYLGIIYFLSIFASWNMIFIVKNTRDM